MATDNRGVNRGSLLGAGAAFLAAFAISAVTGLSAQTQNTSSPRAADTAAGKETFQEYCASCHGDRGTGNGPAVSALKKRPPNLRTLAKQKGKGTFPAAEVEAAIRGVEGSFAAHGSPEMPVWGHYFMAIDRTEAEAQQRIRNLVAYIESLQFK